MPENLNRDSFQLLSPMLDEFDLSWPDNLPSDAFEKALLQSGLFEALPVVPGHFRSSETRLTSDVYREFTLLDAAV